MAIPLAFSHLVKVTCLRADGEWTKKCFQEFGSKYVNDFYQKFKAANNRDDKYLYLEAMQNIRFGGQSALLKDMILGKTEDEPEFRAQAIWSAAWEGTVILLIRDMVVERCNRRFGCKTLHPTKKVYFNEFVANVLRDNMGMVIFDLWGCGGW